MSLPTPILFHIPAQRAEINLSHKLTPSSFQFSDQKCQSISDISHTCYVVYQFNCPPFAYPRKTVSVFLIPLPSVYNAM